MTSARRALFLVGVAAAYASKRALQSRIAKKAGERAPVARFAELAGCGQAMFAYGLTLAAVARVTRNPTLVEIAKKYSVAGAIGAPLFEASRFVLAERRPWKGGAMKFFARDGHGVSGHAFAAALPYWPIMTTLGPRLSPLERRALSAALIAWIGFIGWSRVRLNEHHVWNVMLGVSLGWTVGKRACQFIDR